MQTRLLPSQMALIEVGILFLPAIPAYVWLWPNVEGTSALIAQAVVYLYLLAGCLFIGLRRWNLSQIGFNRHGIWLGVICGSTLTIARILGLLAFGLPPGSHPITFQQLAGEILFFFGLVGVVEELLFRGLVYRTLDEWGGARLAILGSALGFGLFHVGWAGPLGVVVISLVGVFWGIIRWRAGGIVGLILAHGLFDIVTVELWPHLSLEQFQQARLVHPALIIIGDVLMLTVLVYLWKIHPRIQRARFT